MDDNVLEDNIIIDPEFSAMIPPLSHEERQQLEVNLVEHGGARDPIVVWMLEEWTPDGCDNSLQIDDYKLDGDGDGRTWKIWDDPDDDENEPYYLEEWPCILLDGHNRYEICTRLGLPFDIHRLRFKSREEAADWIDKNQLGRRNLDPTQMSLLRGRRYNRTKKAVGGDGTNQHSEECGQNVHKARTAESLAAEHGVNEKTIRRDGEFAKAVETLGIERDVVSGAIDAPKYQIVEAARSLPQNPTPEEVQRVVEMVRTQSYIAKPSDEPSQEPRWREDEEQRRAMEQVIRRPPVVVYNTGDNEWYTPPMFIELARQVMGEIDLDPASSVSANEVVKAKIIYTDQDNGLLRPWSGRVWLNPPYSSDLIGKFCDKVTTEYRLGNISSAIVLINNATETIWFRTLVECASAVVFPYSRIKFWKPEGVLSAPTQGQAFVYIGPDRQRFLQAFQSVGWGAAINA